MMKRNRLNHRKRTRALRPPDNLSTILTLSNRPASAIVLIRDYLERHPDHGIAWCHLGNMLTGLARYDEARQAYARSIRRCPRSKRHIPYGQLGHMYRMKSDPGLAERWYRRAMRANPNDAGAYIFLGALLAICGRLSEAEALHCAATECKTGCVDEAYLNLGLVLRAQQRFDQARQALE